MAQIATAPEIVMHHLWAAACFYVTAQFTRCLGWFDENFYPAYHEDQEMSLRSEAMGVARRNIAGITAERVLHGGSETLRSASEEQRRFIQTANRL